MTARPFHQLITGAHCSVRRLMQGAAMLVIMAVALVTPAAMLADGLVTSSATLAESCDTGERLAAHAGLSRSHRSIVLLEGRDPGHAVAKAVPPAWTAAHAGMSQHHRSIILAEAEDPANFPAVLAC